ncbi:MAG: hypothetical protein HWD59_12910 [Coxiellaceae bacterium]|nr:MAG: hypothetical protein HWD59_12910 [Coxiellaceae bacterium]
MEEQISKGTANKLNSINVIGGIIMKSLISSVKQTFTYYVAQSYNGVSQLRTSIKTAVTSVQSVTDIYEYAPYIKYVDFSQQNVNIQQWSKLTEPRTLIKQLNREKRG